MPSKSKAFSVPVPLVAGAGQQIITGPGYYKGAIVRETGAVALLLRVWDGTSAAGTIVDVVTVAANGTVTAFTSSAVAFSIGLFVERVTGTTYEGSIRIG